MNILSSHKIKAEALRLGFSACGLAPAEAVNLQASEAFRQWIADGCEAGMNYMRNYEDKRLDPRLLVEGARTVISVALNYFPATFLPENEYQIAWYAYGKDYHDVMKEKLRELLAFIRNEFSTDKDTETSPTPSSSIEGRIFCDTAPILERYWAWRAGLGWIGKNTQLLIPNAGSCFFLGEVIMNAPVDHYDSPQRNRCGSCTRCLNACPTHALEAPFRLNSERCLSYLTIERRGDFSLDMKLKIGKKIYGCDDCQRICPWNRFARPTQTVEFHPSSTLLTMKKEDWHHLTEEQYRSIFKGSAVKRAKYEGLMRNIQFQMKEQE